MVLVGAELQEFVAQFEVGELDSTLLLRGGKPFEWDEIADGGTGESADHRFLIVVIA